MFGLKVIERLLPHRPPFLMVESVIAYVGGDTPVLNAERPIRRSEPVFSGAEPPLWWPSVYIVEGLAQSSNLLNLLWTLELSFAAKELDAGNIGNALMNMEANSGDYTTELLLEFLEENEMKTFSRIGMLALVDIEVTGRVRAGELLRYEVQQTRVFGKLSRFAVNACVGKRVIVRGTMVGAMGVRLEGTA